MSDDADKIERERGRRDAVAGHGPAMFDGPYMIGYRRGRAEIGQPMSEPTRDPIRETHDEDLLRELLRRHESREGGKCDYCGEKRDSEPTTCAKPERHERREAGAKLEVACSCGTRRTIRSYDGGWICDGCKSFNLRVPGGEALEGDLEVIQWSPDSKFVFSKHKIYVGPPKSADRRSDDEPTKVEIGPGESVLVTLEGRHGAVQVGFAEDSSEIEVSIRTPRRERPVGPTTARKLKLASKPASFVEVKLWLHDDDGAQEAKVTVSEDHPLAKGGGKDRGWSAYLASEAGK